MKKQYVGVTPFFYVALALLCLAYMPLVAQERGIIYLIDESAIGDISLVDVSDKKVKNKYSSGKQNTLSTAQVVLLFNETGNYLTYPGVDKQKSELERFVSSENTRQADFIITLDQRVIPGTIVSENEYEFYYQTPENGQERSVRKDQVAIMLCEASAWALYGKACVLARSNKLEDSFAWYEKAFQSKEISWTQIKQDELITSVAKNKRFKSLVKKYL